MSLYDLIHLEPALPIIKIATLESKEAGLSVGYAAELWEAGNRVVALVFATSFGFFLVIAQNTKLRLIALDHRRKLVLLALMGNAALAFLVFRLFVHEHRVVETLTDNFTVLDAGQSAFEMRVILLIANLAMFLWIVLFVLRRRASDQP